MASFGDGFSRGLMGGYALGERYNNRQQEKQQGKLFEAAYAPAAEQELQQEGQMLNEQGQQRQNIMGMMANATQGDITKAIVDNYVAGGGKINEHTYKLASGVASTLFGATQMEKEYQQKSRLFEKKMQNYDSQIARRSQLSSGGTQAQKEKRTRLMQNADYIREKYGEKAAQKYVASNWTAKEFADMDDDTPTPEEQPQAKKPSWKDYLK